MDRCFAALAGAGIGAGLMYLLDPQMGRRRRALARDKASRLAHEAQEAANVVSRDMTNRAQGLASGDLSVLVGGKRALAQPFEGNWSPSARAMMVGVGAGFFAYGLTRQFPEACVLGTIGLGLLAEGVSNLGVRDIARAATTIADASRFATEGRTEQRSQSRGAFKLSPVTTG
jgi:hypothetical protein